MLRVEAKQRPAAWGGLALWRASGERRGRYGGSIYWDESRKRHIGAVDLGLSPAGTRIRKKVSGKTKGAHRELHPARRGIPAAGW